MNEKQKYEVLEIILEDCNELKWDKPPNANELTEKYSTKDIPELIREQYVLPSVSVPEDLVMDWDEFMIDYWKEYPETYFIWMMKETMEEYERFNNRK